jgi:hypothetical protein
LAGELVADALTDMAYAIIRILNVVDYIEEHDIGCKEVVNSLEIKQE